MTGANVSRSYPLRFIDHKNRFCHMSNTEDIDSVLVELEDSISGRIEGTLVASGDGFVVADTLYDDEDAEEIAAMVATTMGVSKRMLSVLGGGAVDQTGIQGGDRNIFLFSAGEEGVLAIVAPEDANVGMINLKARDAAEDIAMQLKRRSNSPK